MDNTAQNNNFFSVKEGEKDPCVVICKACGKEIAECDPSYQRTHPTALRKWIRQIGQEHKASCEEAWPYWRELVSYMLGEPFEGTPLVAARAFLEAGLDPTSVPCPPDRVGDGWKPGRNSRTWEQQVIHHVNNDFACLNPVPEEPRTRPFRRKQRDN